jgi:hypothetical protein
MKKSWLRTDINSSISWSVKSQNLFYKEENYLVVSGYGGLVVSMLASGTQDRGFEPGQSRRIFRAKNAFLRRGSKAVCSMSQICGMLKNPAVYPGSRNLLTKFLGHFSFFTNRCL